MSVISSCVSWSAEYVPPHSTTPATPVVGYHYIQKYVASSDLELEAQDPNNFFQKGETKIDKTDRVSYGVFLEPIDVKNRKGFTLRTLCIMPLFEGDDLATDKAKRCFHYCVGPLGNYKTADIVRIIKDDKDNIKAIFVNPNGSNTHTGLAFDSAAVALCTYPNPKFEKITKDNKFTNFALTKLDPVLKLYSDDEDLESDHKIISFLVAIPKVPPKEKLKRFGKSIVTSFTGSKPREKKT